MPWIVVEVNRQHELVFWPLSGPRGERSPEFEHLPDGVDDNALVDPPAALNALLQRQQINGLLQTTPKHEAEQQTDDEPKPLVGRQRANTQKTPAGRARRLRRLRPEGLDAGDSLRHDDAR
jgi:hypothetical protein